MFPWIILGCIRVALCLLALLINLVVLLLQGIGGIIAAVIVMGLSKCIIHNVSFRVILICFLFCYYPAAVIVYAYLAVLSHYQALKNEANRGGIHYQPAKQ